MVVGFLTIKGVKMPNFKPLQEEFTGYVDTDSATKTAYTKQILNSCYGVLGEKHMNREYISVIVDGNPAVIFKRDIIAVSKDTGHTEITCASDVVI
jgi:hypothetical protein